MISSYSFQFSKWITIMWMTLMATHHDIVALMKLNDTKRKNENVEINMLRESVIRRQKFSWKWRKIDNEPNPFHPHDTAQCGNRSLIHCRYMANSKRFLFRSRHMVHKLFSAWLNNNNNNKNWHQSVCRHSFTIFTLSVRIFTVF